MQTQFDVVLYCSFFVFVQLVTLGYAFATPLVKFFLNVKFVGQETQCEDAQRPAVFFN